MHPLARLLIPLYGEGKVMACTSLDVIVNCLLFRRGSDTKKEAPKKAPAKATSQKAKAESKGGAVKNGKKETAEASSQAPYTHKPEHAANLAMMTLLMSISKYHSRDCILKTFPYISFPSPPYPNP